MANDRIGAKQRFDATELPGLLQQLNSAFTKQGAGGAPTDGLRFDVRETAPTAAPQDAGSPNAVLYRAASGLKLTIWDGTAWRDVAHQSAIPSFGGVVLLAQDGVNEGGELTLKGAGGNADWALDVFGNTIRLYSGGTVYFVLSATGLSINGTVNGTALLVNGTQVVGARQAAITAPTGGTTIDTQARTAIGSILTLLRTHGLMT